jgi:hypothetical protein
MSYTALANAHPYFVRPGAALPISAKVRQNRVSRANARSVSIQEENDRIAQKQNKEIGKLWLDVSH